MGEFEKRITKLLTNNFNSDEGDGYTSPLEIIKIIEDDKKEFPPRRVIEDIISMV